MKWQPRYSVGNEVLDQQHQHILAQCQALADCLGNSSPASAQDFHNIFSALMARVQEHFSTEEALLARCGYPAMDEYLNEREEFKYLASDIITTEHFEKIELQRFLTLWWIGHIVDCGKQFGDHLKEAVVDPVVGSSI
jgi:hemerythrin-like metal-binding protein